jgi:hypothetical protein
MIRGRYCKNGRVLALVELGFRRGGTNFVSFVAFLVGTRSTMIKRIKIHERSDMYELIVRHVACSGTERVLVVSVYFSSRRVGCACKAGTVLERR